MTVNAKKLHMEVEAVRKGITHMRELCGEDDDLLSDMIEGETNVHEFCSKCLDIIDNDELVVVGLKERLEKMQARKKRLEKRIGHVRTIVLLIMDEANEKTLELPQATITARKVQPNIIIKEESGIPSDYWIRGEPKLDRKKLRQYVLDRDAAIQAAMEFDDLSVRQKTIEEINEISPEIPGVTLDNGDLSLTIRRA